ncbi:hypothetical protein [Paraburkholderia terrae]|uniref:hypothetical protein n=1 Tax=Paraburkholderia terrae TaxID=311230 RepID=UPI001EE216F7|nr:hypothetical protein [Paraburkholderia terrae]GJH04993.1 hypothetical protein CBA19C8_30570 [Paraburkholderia terrae]
MSTVRDNLMSRPGYSPYCGNMQCKTMPRTTWNGAQFRCFECGWASGFPAEFITEYKTRWGLGG